MRATPTLALRASVTIITLLVYIVAHHILCTAIFALLANAVLSMLQQYCFSFEKIFEF